MMDDLDFANYNMYGPENPKIGMEANVYTVTDKFEVLQKQTDDKFNTVNTRLNKKDRQVANLNKEYKKLNRTVKQTQEIALNSECELRKLGYKVESNTENIERTESKVNQCDNDLITLCKILKNCLLVLMLLTMFLAIPAIATLVSIIPGYIIIWFGVLFICIELCLACTVDKIRGIYMK